jgi:REP element-mobilizing transposase RayT
VTLFKNKYRVESARLPGWDYSSPGAYFVTICTKGMRCWFGDVVDGEMQLSPLGEIVAEEWVNTEQIRPNVTLDQWIVMPNHFHGIVIINEMPSVDMTRNAIPSVAMTDGGKRFVETTRRVVSTRETLKPNSLGSIIGQFKSVSTKRIHEAGFPKFAWQPRFHDHIIRSERSLNKIRHYIVNNVLQWEFDRNHPCGLIDWNSGL